MSSIPPTSHNRVSLACARMPNIQGSIRFAGSRNPHFFGFEENQFSDGNSSLGAFEIVDQLSESVSDTGFDGAVYQPSGCVDHPGLVGGESEYPDSVLLGGASSFNTIDSWSESAGPCCGTCTSGTCTPATFGGSPCASATFGSGTSGGGAGSCRCTAAGL